MKVYNSYIIILAFSLLLTTVILVARGLNLLDAYYTIYVIEALVITELYLYLNSKARHGLTLVSMMLFIGFVVILCLQVIKILTIRA